DELQSIVVYRHSFEEMAQGQRERFLVGALGSYCHLLLSPSCYTQTRGYLATARSVVARVTRPSATQRFDGDRVNPRVILVTTVDPGCSAHRRGRKSWPHGRIRQLTPQIPALPVARRRGPVVPSDAPFL